MVLQKDVREFDSSCPPKADASLKPGEFEVGATEVVRSRAYLLSAVCGPLCTLTHLAETLAEWKTREVLFMFWRERSGGELLSLCSLFLKSSLNFFL